MSYSKLGKSDLEVSTISFGCMSLKADQNPERAISLIREA